MNPEEIQSAQKFQDYTVGKGTRRDPFCLAEGVNIHNTETIIGFFNDIVFALPENSTNSRFLSVKAGADQSSFLIEACQSQEIGVIKFNIIPAVGYDESDYEDLRKSIKQIATSVFSLVQGSYERGLLAKNVDGITPTLRLEPIEP